MRTDGGARHTRAMEIEEKTRSVAGAAVLDDPVGESLRGRHASLSRRRGRVRTYAAGISTFAAVPADADAQVWMDFAELAGRGAIADLFSSEVRPPSDWDMVLELPGRQMMGPDRVATPAPTGPDLEIHELGAGDVPDMLDLVARTRPGPFLPRTHELGTYLGIREHGKLVAMAGERLRPPGWTEISAVCTAPEARGRGCAARLIGQLCTRIADRGERPFLHVIEANPGAIALYERLGFVTRKRVTFRGYRIP